MGKGKGSGLCPFIVQVSEVVSNFFRVDFLIIGFIDSLNSAGNSMGAIISCSFKYRLSFSAICPIRYSFFEAFASAYASISWINIVRGDSVMVVF